MPTKNHNGPAAAAHPQPGTHTAPPPPTFDGERVAAEGRHHGPLDVRNVLAFLIEVAAPHMSEAELHWVAGADEHATYLAGYAAELAEGLGCLVGADTEVGMFRSQESLTSLLLHLSCSFKQIEGLVEMASDARFWRDQRREKSRGAA